MEGTRAGKASLNSVPLPDGTDELCQHFSPVQNLSGPKHIHITTDKRHYIVYLDMNSLPSACINTTSTKTNGRMWDIEAKCTALLLCCMYLQGQRNGMVTAAWLQTWNFTGRQASPPHTTKFPSKLAYLYVYAVNMAYITSPEQDEAPDTSADVSTPH